MRGGWGVGGTERNRLCWLSYPCHGAWGGGAGLSCAVPVLVTFVTAVTKHLTEELKEGRKGLFWLRALAGEGVATGVCEAAGEASPTVRKLRRETRALRCCSPSESLQHPSHGTMPTASQVGLPGSVSPIWKTPHMCLEVCFYGESKSH